MKIAIIVMFLSVIFLMAPAQIPIPFTASIAYPLNSGNYANGDYTIFFGFNNSVIDKPIIIVEGFDPENIRNGENIYDAFNTPSVMSCMN